MTEYGQDWYCFINSRLMPGKFHQNHFVIINRYEALVLRSIPKIEYPMFSVLRTIAEWHGLVYNRLKKQ